MIQTGQKALLTVALWVLVVICGFAQGAYADHVEHHVVDFHGEHFYLETVPQRIVTLGPGALRLVVYMGLVDRVVGIERMDVPGHRTEFRPYLLATADRLKKIDVVAEGGPGGSMPDVERLAGFPAADIYVAVGLSPMQKQLIVMALNKPVVALSYGQGLGLFRRQAVASLSILGNIFHKEERAARLTNYITSLEDDLFGRTRGLTPKMAYIGGIHYKGRATLFSTEAGFPALEMAGGVNLAGFIGAGGMAEIDMSVVEKFDPEFIFLDAGGMAEIEPELAAHADRFAKLRAVKRGNVFVVPPYNGYNTNIETVFITAYMIGKAMHPKAFDDIDIEKKTREIYDFFLDCGECRAVIDAMPRWGRMRLVDGRLIPAGD